MLSRPRNGATTSVEGRAALRHAVALVHHVQRRGEARKWRCQAARGVDKIGAATQCP